MKKLITLFALMFATSTALASDVTALGKLLGYKGKMLKENTVYFLGSDDFELLNVSTVLGNLGTDPINGRAYVTMYTFYSSELNEIVECATKFVHKNDQCVMRDSK